MAIICCLCDVDIVATTTPKDTMETQYVSSLHLFLSVSSGTFDIFMGVEGTDKLVGCYDNQGSFGELALMYNTPRAATIVATSPGALHRELFFGAAHSSK